MESFGRLVSRFMHSIGAYQSHDPEEREVVERWLNEVYLAAAIKKSTHVTLSPTNDRLAIQAHVHGSRSSCNGDRLRSIDFRRFETLKAHLLSRTGCNEPRDDQGVPFYGEFDETVGDLAFNARVHTPRGTNGPEITLRLTYVTH